MTTQALGATPFTGSKPSGRAYEEWGGKRVVIAEITSATITNGTVPFDHTTIGVDFVPTAIFGTYIGSDKNYLVGGYDPTNHVINVWDAADGDNGNADTPTGRFVLIILGQ